jgi:hypothetical protein
MRRRVVVIRSIAGLPPGTIVDLDDVLLEGRGAHQLTEEQVLAIIRHPDHVVPVKERAGSSQVIPESSRPLNLVRDQDSQSAG